MDYSQWNVLQRVQEAMRDQGLNDSQETIAAKFSVRQPSVSAWQSGAPELVRAIEIARELNICVEWLLTGRGPKRPGPPMEIKAQKFWDLWGRVPDDGRSELIGHAEAKIPPLTAASSRLRSTRGKSKGSSSAAP